MNKRIFKRPRKRRNEHFAFGVRSEGGRESANENTRVCADGWFGIELGFGEVAEEVVVEDSVGEL